MKTLLKILQVLVIVSVLFGCATVSPAVLANREECPNAVDGFVAGRFVTTKNSTGDIIGISIRNVDNQKEVTFKCDLKKENQIQLAKVTPGKYRISRWVVTSGWNDLAGGRYFPNDVKPFSIEFEVKPNTITYIGDYFVSIKTIGFKQWSYSVDKVYDNFEITMKEIKEKYIMHKELEMFNMLKM